MMDLVDVTRKAEIDQMCREATGFAHEVPISTAHRLALCARECGVTFAADVEAQPLAYSAYLQFLGSLAIPAGAVESMDRNTGATSAVIAAPGLHLPA